MTEPVQPTQLTAHHEVRGDAVVVRFGGEVDLAVSGDFWSHLAAGLNRASATSARLLIIDLHAVTFFGSNGLSDLVRCHAEGAGNGVAMRVASPSHIVLRVIQATRLDEIFEVYATVEEALGSSRDSRPEGAN